MLDISVFPCYTILKFKRGCDPMEQSSTRLILQSRLKQERVNHHMTQGQLAASVGAANASSVANWEAGVSSPDIGKLARLAQVFDVSLDYLVGLKDIRSPLLGENEPESDAVVFTDEDKQLKRLFETCDDQGQGAIRELINYYCKLAQRTPEGKIESKKASSDSNSPLFLQPEDNDYDRLWKASRTTLRQLKRGSKQTYSNITRYLWDIGYGDEIFVAAVIGVFGYGITPLVPSQKLYDDIEAFLSGRYVVLPNFVSANK